MKHTYQIKPLSSINSSLLLICLLIGSCYLFNACTLSELRHPCGEEDVFCKALTQTNSLVQNNPFYTNLPIGKKGMLLTGGTFNENLYYHAASGTMIGDIQPEAEKSPANFMATPLHPFQIGAYNNTLKKAILTGGIDQTSVTMATFPTILDFQNHSKDITQFIISDNNTPFATLGTPNDKLNLARAGHTFNWLSGDTTALLVGGGSTGELERMSWHTNGQLNTITVLPTPLATNRYWHTTTAYTHFDNQLLLILGGIDANLQMPTATAELYDVANKELVSSFNLSMPEPRVFHTTTYLPEHHKILISGGYDGNNTLGSAIIFEVYGINEASIGGAFTLLFPMSPARQHHTATYIKENEKVILIGGINENTGELVEEISLFNPNKNEFIPLNCSLVTPRYGHSTSYFINPYNSNEIDILVYGGRSSSNEEAEALDTYEIITLNLACPLEK